MNFVTYSSLMFAGAIQTFLPDASRSWVVAGTLRGVMTVWDVRFGVQVMAWTHPFRVCDD